MRRLLLVFILVSGCGGSASRPGAVSPQASQSVLLVSFDGFRADYLDRGLSPTLDSLARAGVRARWMTPSFPSKTFPNHYTLVTGLLPDHHGIVSNNMWDDSLGAFSMANRAAVQNAAWWGGEPIWVTAETQGRRASAFFWPGSEAKIKGVYPSHWMAFDDNYPDAARVDSVLAWLDVPDAQRPVFSTLYYSNVDHAGHSLGPDAPETNAAIAHVDSMLALLTAGLQQRGLAGKVNLVVVADHGMSAVSAERIIVLDDYIDLDSVRVIDWTPAAMLESRSGENETLYRRLRGAHPNLQVYRKAEIPSHYRFGTHPRIPAIVAIADDGWHITSRARVATFNRGGDHGFDQTLPSMRALFVASGPAFRQGVVVEPFSNIHVYELMTHIAGLRPAPNDGSLDSVRVMLK